MPHLLKTPAGYLVVDQGKGGIRVVKQKPVGRLGETPRTARPTRRALAAAAATRADGKKAAFADDVLMRLARCARAQQAGRRAARVA